MPPIAIRATHAALPMKGSDRISATTSVSTSQARSRKTEPKARPVGISAEVASHLARSRSPIRRGRTSFAPSPPSTSA